MPAELQVVGGKNGHFEIVRKKPMKLEDFQKGLEKNQVEKIKLIMEQYPEITFKNEFLIGDDHELKLPRYRSNILVSLPNGKSYDLSFFDPDRIYLEVKQAGFLIEKNWIVIDEINIGKIKEAVEKMYAEGLFNDLDGVSNSVVAYSIIWFLKYRLE